MRESIWALRTYINTRFGNKFADDEEVLEFFDLVQVPIEIEQLNQDTFQVHRRSGIPPAPKLIKKGYDIKRREYPMIHVKTLAPEDNPRVDKANREMEEMFGGIVPQIFTAMNLRIDLLEIILQFVWRLMIEDHGLNRFTKELLAAYVSKLNACAY